MKHAKEQVKPVAETLRGEDAYALTAVEQQRSTLADLGPALKTPGLKNKIMAVGSVYQHHRIGRALTRYGIQDGQMLAGGMSYMAIFSIAALVTVAWSVFAHFFTADDHFQTLVVSAVNHYIPGLLADPGTGVEGLINPSEVAPTTGSVVAAVIALILGSVSAMQIVRYTTEGIRAMFGLMDFPGLMLKAYVRYFLGLLLLILAVLVTAFLSVLSQTFENWVTTVWPETVRVVDTVAFDIGRLMLPSIIDFAMFYAMVRFVSRVRVPHRTMVIGSVAFAVASLMLRSGGTALMTASQNPVIAAAATVVALLLWINILARVTLYICAWMADPPAVVMKLKPEEVLGNSRPNYVTLHSPVTLNWPHHPVTGDLIPARRLDQADPQIADLLDQAGVREALETPTASSSPTTSPDPSGDHNAKSTTTGA